MRKFLFLIPLLLFQSDLHAQPAIGGMPLGGEQDYSASAACFSQKVESLHLPQFSKKEPDQIGGTCYSYASVGTVEASLYRANKGVQKSLPELLPGIAVCATGVASKQDAVRDLSRNSRGLLDNSYGETSTAIDGLQVSDSLNALLAMGRVPTTNSPQKAELKEIQDKFLNRGDEISARVAAHELNANARLRALSRERDSLMARMAEESKRIVEIQERIMKAARSPDSPEHQADVKVMEEVFARHNALSEKSQALWKEEEKIRLDVKLTKEEAALDLCDAGRCYINAAGEIARKDPNSAVDLSQLGAHRLDAEGSGPDESEQCNPFMNQVKIDSVMKSLCVGLPVAAAIDLKHTKRKSTSAGNAWEPQSEGQHAMIVQGVRHIDGKPHFVFRNSWGDQEGNNVIVPFSEACRLWDMVSVYNRSPLDGEEVSEGRALFAATSTDAVTDDRHAKAKALMESRMAKGWIEIKKQAEKAPEVSPDPYKGKDHNEATHDTIIAD